MTELQRLKNVLDQMDESRMDRYLSMFKFAESDTSILTKAFLGELPRILSLLIEVLKKDDRITWFLRLHRITYLSDLASFPGESKAFAEKHKSKYVQEFMIGRKKESLPPIRESDIVYGGVPYHRIRRIEHFLSLGYDKIDKVVFGYLTDREMADKLGELEKEWRAGQGRDIKKNRGKTLLKFQDGWQWVDLGKPFCDEEGAAMGHCGNKGGYKNSDTVLSLREPRKDGVWRPHLTFILDTSTRYLGEMKGYANNKPEKKYHPYIVGLLKLPLIKGIYSGHGYLPENNFDVDDLDDGLLQEIEKANPRFEAVGYNDDEDDDDYTEEDREFLRGLDND